MNNFIQLVSGKMPDITVEENKDLTQFLTLKTDTKAEYFAVADNRQNLIGLRKLSHDAGIPFSLIGGGSNLAIFKPVIPGLTVLNRYQRKAVIAEDPQTVLLEVSSGYIVNLLVNETVQAGYSGFQYQLGLPGTVGGAIYMNSKWTKPPSYFGDNLVSARLVTPEGQEKSVEKSYFQFAYDSSILQQTDEILLEAVFRLEKKDTADLRQAATEAMSYRRQTQPVGVATCGCFFRNISKDEMLKHSLPTTSAGYLIDKAGLKGTKVGSFLVSDRHANFIINTAKQQGRPEDLKKLLYLIKDTVKRKFGIDLEEEVRLIS